MTITITETQMPDAPPYPLFDTDRLKARISALPPERMSTLGELWTANGLGTFSGLVTAEEYRVAERLVNGQEPTAPANFSHIAIARRLDDLPEHIQSSAWGALEVYAGTRAIAE